MGNNPVGTACKGEHAGMSPWAALVLAFGVLLLLLFFWAAQTCIKLYGLRDMPGPAQDALQGNLVELINCHGQTHLLAAKWDKEYGREEGVYQLRVLFQPVVVVTEPALYAGLLAGPARLQKATRVYAALEMMTRPRLPNILTSPEDAHWRSVRKAITPAFGMTTLRQSFPSILAVTERLISGLHQLPPGSALDMDHAAQRLTIDMIGVVGFDRDFGATDLGVPCPVLETVRHLTTAMQQRNNPLNRWFPWRKHARDLRYWGAKMDATISELLREIQAKPSVPQHTLASHLLRCRNVETGKLLSNDQLKAELGLLVGAGFETSSHTIVWALFLAATHPEVEARVVAELRSRGLLSTPEAPTPRQLQWEDLSQLKYLNAVLSESMRLLPAASSGTMRRTSGPTRIGRHTIPSGVNVWVPAYAVQRGRHWADPDAFKPERWLSGDGGGGAGGDAEGGGSQQEGGETRAFMPFGEGPRACVGQSLALLEVRAVLALLWGHFSFELTPDMGGYEGVLADARQHVTLRPEHGLHMYVRARRLGPPR